MTLLFFLLLAVLIGAALPLASQAEEYKLPPPEVVGILDTPPPPAAVLSPDRSAVLLVDYRPYPSIELLARPFLRLGGLRIDPARSGSQRTTEYTGITILRIADGERTRVALPEGAKIGVPAWSFDSRRFAFTRDTETGIEVWVADARTGACRALPGLRVSEVLTAPFAWMDDSRHLLVSRIPAHRGTSPEASLVPTGPVVEETAGKRTQAATYQDLLQNAHDERLFEYYATAQLARADTETGEVTSLGKPDLFLSARPSPDEKYLLVTRLRRPFSYRVPYFYFSRTVEVWESGRGTPVVTIADLPVSDEVPRQGVPTGPRSVTWQESRDATLLWAEALDQGDPTIKVDHRDRIMRLSAPFTEAPAEILKVTHRFAGWDWTKKRDRVFLTEYDRDRRWRTTYQLDLAHPAGDARPEAKRVVFDLSVNDAYNDPGGFVYQTGPSGDHSLLQDGEWVYLSGAGATEQGDRPFLDRMSLETLERERLWRCDEDSYEFFIAFPRNDRDTLLTRRETNAEPPNYFLLQRSTSARTPLTHFPDPHPQITGLKKERVKYTRADGVPLSGTLYLPPDYDPASGKRLPLVLWAYPEEYSDAATAGQVRGSTRTFTRLAGTSPLWFVTQGYAVLNDATMPVVGDPETMNDTFVEQIVGAAKAAIEKLDGMGLIDPKRVLVAGHSYGAFMTANLLAHSDLFAAGIARSGAYNRTLTPFGFQSERRSYWEVPDVYHRLSPFAYAHKIAEPLLLLHGAEDNNPGTYTLQSERLFQAIQGTGGTARLVLLPHESHGYRARESVLHVLAEMFEWADRYVKNRQVQ